MTSDPISDMLLRVRNALKAGLPTVELPGSRIKGEIARVMKEEGYITNFTMTAAIPRVLSIELKYNDAAEPAMLGKLAIDDVGEDPANRCIPFRPVDDGDRRLVATRFDAEDKHGIRG